MNFLKIMCIVFPFKIPFFHVITVINIIASNLAPNELQTKSQTTKEKFVKYMIHDKLLHKISFNK